MNMGRGDPNTGAGRVIVRRMVDVGQLTSAGGVGPAKFVMSGDVPETISSRDEGVDDPDEFAE